MLSKTRAIVLHHIKHGENGIILYAYTEKSGRQTYIINGVRKNKARFKANLFQPLTILDLDVYKKDTRDLHHVREINCPLPYRTIPYVLVKTVIAMFISELLYKLLREEESHPELFEFLLRAFAILDDNEEQLKNFNLVFMIYLSEYLGVMPTNNFSETTPWFDLREGRFLDKLPEHSDNLDIKTGRLFNALLNTKIEELESLSTDATSRRSLTDALLRYFNLHFSSLSELKSLDIIRELLYN